MAAVSSEGARGLSFGVLGPVVATRDGIPLALGGRQQRAVLALLLTEVGRPVSLGRIADALWGERPSPGFAATVQTYIFHLRQALEPGRGRGSPGQVIVTDHGGYRLDIEPESVDAVQFANLTNSGRTALAGGAHADAAAKLTTALDLWRGEVLADVADLGFVGPFAARLDELRLGATEDRIEALLRLGRPLDVVAEIDGLIARHPLRERLHAQRMLALYRCGRQSDALSAYRSLRALLDEELGIEPSPQLQALQEQILRQDEELSLPSPAAVATAVQATGLVRAAYPRAGSSSLPLQRAVVDRPRERRSPPMRRSVLLVAAVTALLLAAAAVIFVAVRQTPRPTLAALPANSVGEINGDGSLRAAVTIGSGPDGIAAAGTSLWAVAPSSNTVDRIDAKRQAVVDKIPVGASPGAIALTGHDAWVANFDDGTVTRINRSDDVAVQTIAVGSQPAAIAAGPSGVWVANSADDTIQRIDPGTGRTGKPIPVGAGPDGLAVTADTVWVANGRDGTVSAIDPRTGTDAGPIPVGSGPRGITVAYHAVWVANQLSQSVTRIDVATQQTSTFVVGDGPDAIVAARAALWVSDQYDGTLTKISPTNDATSRYAIGAAPAGLAVIGSTVWTAADAFAGTAHRGGTLRIATTIVPSAYDFAELYDPDSARMERAVYDGLVTFRLAGGADGEVLVPDLAVAIPRPSDGGRTYSFLLRPGIRYSTGAPVHASDFLLAVRRALIAKNGNPSLFMGILGARRCRQHPENCSLSSGVTVDNRARRITFHLAAPDPAFLYKLTLFIYPTPPGTPLTAVRRVLPGTGPYRVASYHPGDSLVLVRNRYFRQWSFAAQAAAYPDVIRWRRYQSDLAAARAVERGVADLTTFYPTPALSVANLARRYPGRLHAQTLAQTSYQVLNLRVAPFNDVRVRRALNYAIDRRKLVSLLGGPFLLSMTCQMLPPDFPAHRPYCPYTRPPLDGHYHGPDLAKARALVADSGTRGTTITVLEPACPDAERVSPYVADVLRSLGYRVGLRRVACTVRTLDHLSAPGSKAQTFTGPGWIADYPLASSFYGALVACSGVNNLGHYCDPRLDSMASAANAAEGSDPGGAIRAWTAIDRAVTKAAPLVFLGNIKDITLVSARVGNYQSSAQLLGPLLSQLWVR